MTGRIAVTVLLQQSVESRLLKLQQPPLLFLPDLVCTGAALLLKLGHGWREQLGGT